MWVAAIRLVVIFPAIHTHPTQDEHLQDGTVSVCTRTISLLGWFSDKNSRSHTGWNRAGNMATAEEDAASVRGVGVDSK